MILIDRMSEKCVLIKYEVVSDGYGGTSSQYNETYTFNATITYDSSMKAKIAEVSGVKSLYTVTTSRDVVLNFHDCIKRISDGKVFRITSYGEDNYSPTFSSLDIRQVSAEEWRIENG